MADDTCHECLAVLSEGGHSLSCSQRPSHPDRLDASGGWDGTLVSRAEYRAAATRLMRSALTHGDGQALRDVKALMDRCAMEASRADAQFALMREIMGRGDPIEGGQ